MFRFRKHISLLFLFCLSYLSIPKKWVHDCHAHEEQTEIHTGFELSEDCHFCHYEFQADNTVGIKVPAAFFEYLESVVICNLSSAQNPQLQQLHNKAPPCLPC